nr:MAG TPA: hypothetical protein [Bacteriophage sp.]
MTVFIYRRKISKQPSLLHVNVEGFFVSRHYSLHLNLL